MGCWPDIRHLAGSRCEKDAEQESRYAAGIQECSSSAHEISSHVARLARQGSGRTRLAASINQAVVHRHEHKDLLRPTIARQDPAFCLTVQTTRSEIGLYAVFMWKATVFMWPPRRRRTDWQVLQA